MRPSTKSLVKWEAHNTWKIRILERDHESELGHCTHGRNIQFWIGSENRGSRREQRRVRCLRHFSFGEEKMRCSRSELVLHILKIRSKVVKMSQEASQRSDFHCLNQDVTTWSWFTKWHKIFLSCAGPNLHKYRHHLYLARSEVRSWN